jgi:poly [ADP-ribose] polymerase
MGLLCHKYGANTHKGKVAPHPGSWGKTGLSDDYEVVKNTVLQVTDVTKNNNKFYSLELHKHNISGEHRLFSHYGRTDDLENKGENAGTKECRYGDQYVIEAQFETIIKSKKRKGYCEVNLAKSNIGSDKARGQSVGIIDQKTLNAMDPKTKKKKKTKQKKKSLICTNVRRFVQDIYRNAGHALTQKANVKITADGFATPLGVLTLGQVDTGFDILSEIRAAIQKKKKKEIDGLSGNFYTTIPHNVGRSRAAIQAAVINTIDKSDEVEKTLQLMKDMLNVNQGSDQNLFATDEVDDKYDVLKTKLGYLSHTSTKYKELTDYVTSSQSSYHGQGVQVKDIFEVNRHGSENEFDKQSVGNVKELFHGTRSENVVGIMTRGLLLPNIAARHGAQITGAMFGPGLYFADQSSKSANYCGYSYDSKTRYMFIAGVALGKIKKYRMAQTGLREPPRGYNSVMGEASVNTAKWNYLVHNEYIIFKQDQQILRYIIEFTG